MEVTLIRHLPTPGNKKKQYIGRTDEPLDRKAVEEFLKKLDKSCGCRIYPQVGRVITSPMKRCIQTSQLLCSNVWTGIERAKIVEEPMFAECDFGRFEKKTYQQLKDDPDYKKWLDSAGTMECPDGESMVSFRARCTEGMRKWIRLLAEEGAEQAAFIVHGGTVMAVMEKFEESGKGFYCWQPENGSGFTVEADPQEWAGGRERFYNVRRAGLWSQETGEYFQEKGVR